VLLVVTALVVTCVKAPSTSAALWDIPECHIRGTVTDGQGHGLPGVTVTASAGSFLYVATTDASGSYDILVELYDYRWAVWFGGGYVGGVYYVGEYYSGVDDPNQATLILLTEADSIKDHVDASLRAHGSISGRVCDLGGRPLAGAYVELRIADYLANTTHTDEAGRYVFTNLWPAPQQYKLELFGPENTDFVPQWYNGWNDTEGDGTVRDKADWVSVPLDTAVGLQDALLHRFPRVVGEVTDTSGAPMTYAGVGVYDVDDEPSYVANTNASGEYAITLGRPGIYFFAFNAGYPYVSEFYNDKATLEDADGVYCGLDTVTTANAVLSRRGSISGTVTNTAGLPVANVSVDAWALGEEYPSSWGETDDLGRYVVEDLDAGDYLIQVTPDYPFVEQWYDDKPTSDEADSVHVSNDATTTVDMCVSSELPADVTAPSTSRSPTDSNWHAGPIIVTLTAIDNQGGWGVAYTEYSRSGGLRWIRGTSIVFDTWKRGGGSGARTMMYRSVDYAGNKESPKSVTVFIDGRAPCTTDDAPVVPVTTGTVVTLAPVDPLSGVKETWWSLDNGTWTKGTSVAVPAVNGYHFISYYSVDNVGNVESVRSCTVLMQIGAKSVHHGPQRRRR
jgi:protocatechuate 3,4-dioxygenase beta subunit